MSQTIRVVTGLTTTKRRTNPAAMEKLRDNPHLYETLKALDKFQNVEPVFEDIVLQPGGGGASDEILAIVDLSTADQTYTLQDPATLPNPNTTVVVKVWNAGGYLLHIDPGVGLTIDGIADGIRTRTPNQAFCFRWGPSADEFVGTTGADGWVCTKIVFGGGEGGTATGAPPEGTPGDVACSDAVPNWISDPTLAVDYQVLTDADGTYNKPDIPGARFVGVVGWGSGAGGGAGDYGEASGGAAGGSAGGAGARRITVYDYATFPAAVTYHVAQGGAGAPRPVNTPAPPPGGYVPAQDGADGEASTLTESITGDVFTVGGGLKGLAGPGGYGDQPGGEGGSWNRDGSGFGTNANGTGEWGGGPISAGHVTDTPPLGCAECGGGSGAGGDEISGADHGPADGGSSQHGGGGGGAGAGWAFPTYVSRASDGGSSGSSTNGGGGAHGTSTQVSDVVTAGSGADGAAGTGLDGGKGGGGGGADNVRSSGPDLQGGDGGNGGIPGGGGGGGGAAANNGVHTKTGGGGGNGARGELRISIV